MCLGLALAGCGTSHSQETAPPGARTVAQQPAPSQTAGPVTTISPALPLPQPSPRAIPSIPVKAKVALLLPLTGVNAELGQAMLNAAQQAVFDASVSGFELMPRDTGSGEATAVTAARDAVASGAQLLIGPLFAANVPAVHQAVAGSGVGVLTLSSDASVAGADVYVMGFTPDTQVARVVGYAAARGAQRFAALVPGNAYGLLVMDAFQNAVARAGGAVVAVETYNPDKHDSELYARDLATRKETIDALFLPESGAELTAIAGQLAAAGFNPQNLHVLGTGLWDVPGLAKQTPFIAGGWYAAPDPEARRGFMRNYAANYGQEPPRLATLAYDATALAAALAKRGVAYDRVALTNPNGFAGLDGIFRLLPDGRAERGLAVLEVTPDGARVIDPAPTSFAVTKN
jgi:ABC-type branched-subunit amino acid transport system substrate-binding protein